MIRFRPLLVPTLWFVPALALLAGLGVWQIERLHWKEDLIARVESRMAAPAAPLDDVLVHGLANAEWRRVQVHGYFPNDSEVYLFAPSAAGQPGYHVIAPFVVAGGDHAILVDRGYVPEDLKDPRSRKESFGGEERLTGIVRLSQPPGLFTPAPDPRTRVWFNRDARAMAEALRVAPVAPIIVEEDGTPGAGEYPRGGQTRVDFPNNHLQYALTWFALALVLTAVYLLYHRKQGRLG